MDAGEATVSRRCGGDGEAVVPRPRLLCNLFFFFPERKDEARLRPGGNVFSLHGRGAREQAALSNLYFSLSAVALERGRRRGRQK